MISQGPSMCIFNKEDKGEVLASWLFMQFMLTNDVQISYSQTEGYLPVTTKAHSSDEYKDYLDYICNRYLIQDTGILNADSMAETRFTMKIVEPAAA